MMIMAKQYPEKVQPDVKAVLEPTGFAQIIELLKYY